MKQKSTTAMLLISTVLLGGFIWFFEREGETSHQKNIRQQTVFSVNPEKITSLTLERGDSIIQCSKLSDMWHMEAPVAAPVDRALLERMVAGMANVKRGDRLSSQSLKERGLTPSDYGFDEPRATITYQNDNGTTTWFIGGNSTLGDTLYVMEKGTGDIITASQNLLNLVPGNASWIRDRTLFPLTLGTISGIDLQRPKGFLQMRHSGALWSMQQPHKSRADLIAVNTLVEKIMSVRTIEFITDEKTDLTVYGLKSPAYELTLQGPDHTARALLIGKVLTEKPETTFAKWEDSDSVFTVPTEWVLELDIGTDNLRNRHLLGALPGRISELNIDYNDKRLQLTQVENTWSLTIPFQWQVEQKHVQSFLQEIIQLPVLGFCDTPTEEETARMAAAPWTIRFTVDDEIHTLKVSLPSKDHTQLVQRNDEASYYIIPAHIIREDFANPIFFRGLTVLRIQSDQIKKITQEVDGEEYIMYGLDGQFTVSSTTSSSEMMAIHSVTEELSNLQAVGFVEFNPKSLVPFGLDQPMARLRISLNSTNVPGHVVLIGAQAEGGYYSMIQGEDSIFVLSEKSVNALTQKLTTTLEKTQPETP